MTTINIGTSKKNIIGVEVSKAFRDITFRDIQAIVTEHLGINHNAKIHGWALIKELPEETKT